jgi:hypothetical protein
MKAHHKVISNTIWLTHFKTKWCHIQCSNRESAWKSWTEITQSLHKLYTYLSVNPVSPQTTHKSAYLISPQTCTQICIGQIILWKLQCKKLKTKIVWRIRFWQHREQTQLNKVWSQSDATNSTSPKSSLQFTEIPPHLVVSEWICRPLFWRNSSAKEDSS